MKRLFATIHCDVQLQVRNGFYYATAFILAFWIVIWSQLDLPEVQLDLRWLLPMFVLSNIIITTFYYISGLVLLEKGEGTLEAQVVTPLRTEEYLTAKVVTLVILTLIENIIIVSLFQGFAFGFFALTTGVTLASAMYILAGFAIVARYNSINEYLFPSILYSSALSLPLLTYIAGWDHWLIYLHPLQAPLVLMHAAFQTVVGWQILYAILYSGLWIGLLYRWSRQAFWHFIIAKAGAD